MCTIQTILVSLPPNFCLAGQEHRVLVSQDSPHDGCWNPLGNLKHEKQFEKYSNEKI